MFALRQHRSPLKRRHLAQNFVSASVVDAHVRLCTLRLSTGALSRSASKWAAFQQAFEGKIGVPANITKGDFVGYSEEGGYNAPMLGEVTPIKPA